MKGAFFIVGPTAAGKSGLAADVASEIGAEIVNADAFQLYRGLDLLTGKPEPETLRKTPHHLIGTIPLHEEMNAEKFRSGASRVIDEIHSRGKPAIVVGGSGLYVKGLTHGLTSLVAADPELRQSLNQRSLEDLKALLVDLDPETARKIDTKNRQRLVRALEICLATGRRAAEQRTQWVAAVEADRCGPKSMIPATGIFVFRERQELYSRINERVEAMFENGVIEEVRAAGATSSTASQTIGLHEIHELLEGKMSMLQCVAAIQQATRRYAKRQLTWFRRQTNFEPLNLSLLSHDEAVKWISLRARRSFAHGDD